jgi:hypothetical protein
MQTRERTDKPFICRMVVAAVTVLRTGPREKEHTKFARQTAVLRTGPREKEHTKFAWLVSSLPMACSCSMKHVFTPVADNHVGA